MPVDTQSPDLAHILTTKHWFATLGASLALRPGAPLT
jgi:hypothetical protein